MLPFVFPHIKMSLKIILLQTESVISTALRNFSLTTLKITSQSIIKDIARKTKLIILHLKEK